MSLNDLATSLLVPPTNLLPIGLFGAALAFRGWRSGLVLATLALTGMLVLSLPVTANLLIRSLQVSLPESQAGPKGVVAPDAVAAKAAGQPAAIVILSAEGTNLAQGGILTGDDVGGLTLERLRAGVVLQRATDLPILVSGGILTPDRPPIAQTMARVLARDFHTPAHWIEARSTDTWENAAFSADILRSAGVGTVWLVTHAWHMPRALQSFAHTGITALPAPIQLERPRTLRYADFAPSPGAFQRSYWALHEWIGLLAYSFRADFKRSALPAAR